MLGYLLWRFAVEFIKPRETHLGLSAIQVACLIGALVCVIQLRRMPSEHAGGRGDQEGDEPPRPDAHSTGVPASPT
jgi:hypothetical protein